MLWLPVIVAGELTLTTFFLFSLSSREANSSSELLESSNLEGADWILAGWVGGTVSGVAVQCVGTLRSGMRGGGRGD